MNSQYVLEVNNLNVYYGDFRAIKDVGMKIREKSVTALIGPSGCGKSTFLRCLNRMNDLIVGTSIEGEVLFENQNIYQSDVDATEIRSRIGMVFQKPNPFPNSIYQNIAFGLKVNGFTGNMDEAVEKSLRNAALWDEVKDRLNDSAFALSGGQQQRLCIARALAIEPEVILMDEPASALDPIATLAIEELVRDLSKRYTIVIVTHNMQQAARVSEKTAFFHLGKLIEFSDTETIFTKPKQKQTLGYITGRYG